MSADRARPPWWLKYVNKPRSTPATPMTVDGNKYIVGGLPGADWTANVRAAGEGTVQRGRHTQRVRLVAMFSDEFEALAGRCPVFGVEPVDA